MSLRETTGNACLNPNASLGIDQACLLIVNDYNRSVTFYSKPNECVACYGVPQGNISANSNRTFVIFTKYPLHIYYTSDYESCHTTYNFMEHGRYGWNLSASDICTYIYTIHKPPSLPYLPILAACGILLLVAILWTTGKVVTKIVKDRLWRDMLDVHDDLGRLQEPENLIQPAIRTTKFSTRIRSIDTFRGIAMLLMIFVNNGGGKYVFFEHSAWYGLTVADLVLPWFAWIMGLTITVSKRAELRVTYRGKIFLRNFVRSLTLICLGLMLNSQHSKYLTDLRFTGILQLLAVTYFVCATLETIFMKALPQFGQFLILRDILDSWIQWVIVLAIIAAHTLTTFLLPVRNCPLIGYLGPGGYDKYNKYVNCTAGAAGYIDRYIFGSHMYSRTDNPVYGTTLPHDPEGIMNTISAILIVYMGVHAGKILLLYYQCYSKILRWMLWAIVTGIIAGILCNFEKEGGVIPVSKKMMTLSYVLTTVSFAFLLFSLLYYLVDYKQVWSGAPFIYSGANSIFLYVGHCITMRLFPWSWTITKPTHASLLAMNIWTTALWAIIAFGLYKKDIVITV